MPDPSHSRGPRAQLPEGSAPLGRLGTPEVPREGWMAKGGELKIMGMAWGSSSVGVLRANLLATCGPRQGQKL